MTKKFKIITAILLVVTVIAVTLSAYLTNELNRLNRLEYARTQTAVNNYQVSFSNAINGLKTEDLTVEQVFYAIEGINSSMQYYESVSNPAQSIEFITAIDSYIAALEEYLLNGADNFNYDIDLITGDLTVIGDWLMQRNDNDILIAHNDDDFCEVYLKLSSELVDEMQIYTN